MRWQSVIILLLLTGCTSNSHFKISREQVIDLLSSYPTYNKENYLLELTQQSFQTNLSDDEKAKIFFEKAVIYDQLGLNELAHFDYRVSQSFNYTYPDTYNLMGIYYTSNEYFDYAYEAFDSSLELEPNFYYAQMNRVLALYYGKRFDLALDEMKIHFKAKPEDAYRLIWLYFIQAEFDEKLAMQTLLDNGNEIDQSQWAWTLIQFLQNKLSVKQIERQLLSQNLPNREWAEKLTELYFYAGKLASLKQNKEKATEYFSYAKRLRVHDFIEYRYIPLEFRRLVNK